MKKTALIAALTAFVLLLTGAHAEIIPPRGEGQIGLSSVVICESLTLRQEPNASAKAVKTLKYGSSIIVMKQSDGWAYCTLGDSEDSPKGWVNADYIAVDPAWYKTDAKTPVYAWNDTNAPKVALLDAGTSLPILKSEGEWLIVSLRGAIGWIKSAEAASYSAAAAQRYEGVIMIEGMEETVRYERVTNDVIGIEIDYDYENFVRAGEKNRERFMSLYDDPADPENYFDVSYTGEDADSVLKKVCDELSETYDIIVEPRTLGRAGSCMHVDASVAKGGKGTPDFLQSVYIIPAGDGCIVVNAYYAFEAAEGFGVRFRYMLDTLAFLY